MMNGIRDPRARGRKAGTHLSAPQKAFFQCFWGIEPQNSFLTRLTYFHTCFIYLIFTFSAPTSETTHLAPLFRTASEDPDEYSGASEVDDEDGLSFLMQHELIKKKKYEVAGTLKPSEDASWPRPQRGG